MKHTIIFWLPLLTALPHVAEAQPFQDFFVTNDANYSFQDAIAPGSIFNLWIAGSLGTLPVHADQGFPLRTSVDGVSVRVTVGTAAVDAFVISTEAVKIRAMLPSNTPLGDGGMTLAINGRTTSARKIRVVRRGFAVYAQPLPLPWWPRSHALAHIIDASGTWSPNTLIHPARPGQLLVLWGTGLGAVAGDERSGPLPGDARPADLEVLAGDRTARVLYAGRSGCCAGVDQIVIEVPAGVEGCSVPLWVRFRDTGDADQLAIALSSSEDACPDLPRDVSEKLDAAHAINIGFISLGAGHAVFGRGGYLAPPLGTCRLGGSPPGELDFSFNDSTRDQAGNSLSVQTPQGSEQWAWSPFGADYESPNPRPEATIPPGEYSVNNGAGSGNIGPFQATFRVPPLVFVWTNRDELNTVRPADSIPITWNGADPDQGYVSIYGETSAQSWIASFTCVASAGQTSFSVPAYVWAGARSGATTRIRLTVGFQSHWKPVRFEAPGLDFAHASYHVSFSKMLTVE